MNAAPPAEGPFQAPPPRGPLGRLSLMMFLQYAIWGAWLPLLWPYLENHVGMPGDRIAKMFMVGAVGAIVAPFIAGQIADRWFPTERYLGISHLVGAALVWQLASIESYGAFLLFSLAYSLVYSPTLSLTNSLAFHHLPDRDRDFGRVRLWGTVGWIAVGIGVGQWLLHVHTPTDPGLSEEAIRQAQFAGMADMFRVSALLGLLLGLYCFFLPHTPPARGAERNAALEALGEVQRQPLFTLFLLAVPVSCIHQFYFVHTAHFLGAFQTDTGAWINQVFGVGGVGLMTIGQMAEIVVLALIPLVAKKVSRKLLLGVGLAAYALRMALFAYVESIPLPTNLTLVLGVALHGLCFGCFIFVAFMVVDEETTRDVRASAQSLFNLVIVGIGVIVGSEIAALVDEHYAKVDGVRDYTRLFSVPMWAALACLLVLLVAYPGGARRARDRTGLDAAVE